MFGKGSVRRDRRPRAVRGVVVPATLLVLLAAAGCVTNDEGLIPTVTGVDVGRVAEIADRLPPSVAASGRLVVGVNTPYAPNEFKDEAGTIVGFDVDLMNAVGAVLGVTVD